MKKIVIILLLTMVLALAGCTDEISKNNAETVIEVEEIYNGDMLVVIENAIDQILSNN
ncbi:lipoprotein [Mycoplasmatota bacterium]|nr:lipoprotein [Mycoplasmatota bacterium]